MNERPSNVIQEHDLDATTPPTEAELAELAALQGNEQQPPDPVGIANPGFIGKKVYTTNAEGERVPGYRRLSSGVIYEGTNGQRAYMPPPGMPLGQYDASFLDMSKKEGLRLVPRAQRREQWKAEKKKRRELEKARKAKIQEIVAAAARGETVGTVET